MDVGNWSICSDLCWCLSLGISISLYFLIAIITEKHILYVLYISWISGFIWRTHISHMVWTCLNNHFAYQIGVFFQNHRQQRMIPPKKTNMTLANHSFFYRSYRLHLEMVVLPCFAIGMSVCRGTYIDGKDYDLWAERLGAEGWSWNEVSWRLKRKDLFFCF